MQSAVPNMKLHDSNGFLILLLWSHLKHWNINKRNDFPWLSHSSEADRAISKNLSFHGFSSLVSSSASHSKHALKDAFFCQKPDMQHNEEM